jgi:thioredoxin 1
MMPGSRTSSEPPREFSVDEFELLVRKAERPVIAAFVATWSHPCHLISPILREIQTAYKGRVELITVDADSNPELGVCYEVRSIPTLLYFDGGRMRARHVGLTSKEAIVSELELLLGRVSVVVSTGQPPSAVPAPGQKKKSTPYSGPANSK